MGSLKELYDTRLKGELQKNLGIANAMETPKIEKIVLNMGLGEAVQNPKVVEQAVGELTRIAGQKAVVTRAKKSIATFKLRQGMPIGSCVTLRPLPKRMGMPGPCWMPLACLFAKSRPCA